ncbi:TPA: hypothetical protein ACG45F_004600, partial [Escherichia coli]
MPLNVRFDIENYLKGINDIRACNFFLRCLYMKNMAIKNIDYYNDIRSCKRVIIQAFDSTNISGQDKDNLCKEIETAIEKEILPLDEFDWVKNDERAAFWICAYLLHTPIISNQMITGSDNIYCPSMSSGN